MIRRVTANTSDVRRLTRSIRLFSYREMLAWWIRHGLTAWTAAHLFAIKGSKDLDHILSLARELDDLEPTRIPVGCTAAVEPAKSGWVRAKITHVDGVGLVPQREGWMREDELDRCSEPMPETHGRPS